MPENVEMALDNNRSWKNFKAYVEKAKIVLNLTGCYKYGY